MKVLDGIFRCACAFICLSSATVAWSQTPAADSDDVAVERPSSGIVETLPPIIYTPDEDGKPTIPWVGSFPWQLVDEFLRKNQRRPEDHYVLKELAISAIITDDRAVLDTQLRLHVFTEDRHVIPIQMGSVHLTSDVLGNERPIVVRFDQEFGEYELFVDGKKDEEIEIRFKSVVELKPIGRETHLRFSIPRVPRSSLSVQIPQTGIHARLNDGTPFEGVETKGDTSEVATLFKISGLQSKVDFCWSPVEDVDDYNLTTMDVTGLVNVHVDALGMISADAALTVSSYGPALESVEISLPQHTRLSDQNRDFGSYRVSDMKTVDGNPVVTVTFADPSATPPVVRLNVKSDDQLNEFELAGFKVAGAASQSGTVSVYSSGPRLINTAVGEFARRVVNPPESRGARATFEYSQPDQVRLSFSEQETELVVQPLYAIQLDETRATLTAIYQCSKRGRSPSSVKLKLGNWNFTSIFKDPDNLFGDYDQFDISPDGSVELPLASVPDRFELSFTAWQRLDEIRPHSGTTLEFELPVPAESTSILQSTIALTSRENMVVSMSGTSDFTEIRRTEEAETLLELDDEANYFRLRRLGAPGPLSLRVSRLSRRTLVDTDIDLIEVDLDHIRIRHQMHWQVKDVPLPHALLKMHKRLYRDGEGYLAVEVNGQSRIPQRLRTFGDSTSNYITIRVPIDPLLAEFDMVVTYDWIPVTTTESPSPLALPEVAELELVQPKRSDSSTIELVETARFRRSRLSGYQVLLNESRNADLQWPWNNTSFSPGIDTEIEAVFDPADADGPFVLPLAITQIEEDKTQSDFNELVDRAWFQTWCTNTTRTDRAVFRVQATDSNLRIKMPSSTDFRKLYVFVDGNKREYQRTGASTIDIAIDEQTDTHVVELQYWSGTREPPGLLRFEIPILENAEILGQWYWHIVMPRNECLLTWPRSLTKAHEWDWSVFVPSHRPQLSLAELEEWSGATPSGDRVLSGSTQYLFGAMGETTILEVRTTQLPIYILLFGGGMLVIGLLLIYSKQRVLVLLCIAALIAVLVVVHPSYAAFAGQVSVFGFILVSLASFLKWLIKRPSNVPIRVTPHHKMNDEPKLNARRRGSSIVDDGTTTLAAQPVKTNGER